MTEPVQSPPPHEPTAARAPDTTVVHFIYALYAASIINGLTALIGVIIAYVKRSEAAGTWLESHYEWQIRTFWWGLLFMVIGGVTAFVMIGFLIMFAAGVWVIYRVVKGWVRLNQSRALEDARALI
jgi:uncharacterized membrane protein